MNTITPTDIQIEVNRRPDQAKWDRRFMGLARHIATWSRDPSTKVGSVIADNKNRIVSIGYNGFPRGVDDCNERYTDRTIKYPLMVHAEMNAISFALVPIEGFTIYTILYPCTICMRLIIQRGVGEIVVLHDPNPRWVGTDDYEKSSLMAREAGIIVRSVEAHDAAETKKFTNRCQGCKLLLNVGDDIVEIPWYNKAGDRGIYVAHAANDCVNATTRVLMEG